MAKETGTKGHGRPEQDEPAAHAKRRRASPATQGETPVGRNAPRQRPRPPRPEEGIQSFFAPCPRGLEDELAKELAELGAAEATPGSGGVAFAGDLPLAWRVNLWSRLAVRVLWRLGQGEYRHEDDLYQAAYGLSWADRFAVERSIAVHTIAHASPLKSLNFATLRIKDAICDRFRADTGRRPDVDTRTPEVPLLLYLERARYTLYLDLTGEPLNRRGYRIEAAAAPLNENLAAGLLRLAGWSADVPLLDPMMGGGTVLLEAGLMALNIAPGLKRHFAFEHLASFDRTAWTRLRKDAQAAAQAPQPLAIYGADIDPRMVRAAGLNLKAAGLLDWVRLREADVLEVEAPTESGLIISNPPYGVRLGHDDLTGFYARLGDALKQRFSGWNAWLLSADPDLPKAIGLKASRRIPLYNGPLACKFYEYRMVAGSLRPVHSRQT